MGCPQYRADPCDDHVSEVRDVIVVITGRGEVDHLPDEGLQDAPLLRATIFVDGCSLFRVSDEVVHGTL
jgi:hypothetical protein